jgi:hypothetical protein
MNLEILAWTALALAAVPCALFLINLLIYRRAPAGPAATAADPALSVLIPARNEEANIRATLAAVLASRDAEFEVVVLDDGSTDRTAAIVAEFAGRNARVRLEAAPALPAGWCGKQHACWQLARRARHPLLVFLDADVRLAPDALARMRAFMVRRQVALASGVPRQETGTFAERLLIPLIHFVLLGFLPMPAMRWFRWSAFGAGCGQLFLARADAYRACGGHDRIRATLHDGVKLPKVFRRAGFMTDLFDATDLATCRMYRSNAGTWRGLGKNATEGLAAPGTIVPMTALLAGGQVLPLLLLFAPGLSATALTVSLAALACAYLPRLVGVWRFRQSLVSALLHPLGVLALLAIQWQALGRQLRGRPAVWKGRRYGAPEQTGATPVTRLKISQPGLGLVLAATLGATGVAGGAAGNSVAAEPPPAGAAQSRVASFSLTDQFERVHQLNFPREKVTVLTIADRKGSAQVEGWVRPLAERFGDSILQAGIADVSKVPGLLRGRMRGAFREQFSRPVMLDWQGTHCRALGCERGVVNVLLVAPGGEILFRTAGGADAAGLERLKREIEKALAEARTAAAPAAGEPAAQPGPPARIEPEVTTASPGQPSPPRRP